MTERQLLDSLNVLHGQAFWHGISAVRKQMKILLDDFLSDHDYITSECVIKIAKYFGDTCLTWREYLERERCSKKPRALTAKTSKLEGCMVYVRSQDRYSPLPILWSFNGTNRIYDLSFLKDLSEEYLFIHWFLSRLSETDKKTSPIGVTYYIDKDEWEYITKNAPKRLVDALLKWDYGYLEVEGYFEAKAQLDAVDTEIDVKLDELGKKKYDYALIVWNGKDVWINN